MNKTKEIIKNIILRLEIQDAFFETYGYLDVSNRFTVKERLKRILDIIVYENHLLFESSTNDYAGLCIKDPEGSAINTLCKIVSENLNRYDDDDIIYTTRGLVSIIVDRDLTKEEIKVISDSYRTWNSLEKEIIFKFGIKESYEDFKNTFCAESAAEDEILEIVMMALYVIEGNGKKLYNNFKRFKEFTFEEDLFIDEHDKEKFRAIERRIEHYIK